MRLLTLILVATAAHGTATTAGDAAAVARLPHVQRAGRTIGALPCGLAARTAAALRAVRGYRPSRLVEASAGGRVRRRAGYDWPLAPFGRGHVVRAYVNDPRIDPRGESFHFGIDLSGRPGTAVYAIDAGTVSVEEERSIAVVPASGGRTFTYWHLAPVVGPGQFVRRHQLIGRIAAGWNHVHLSERVAGLYVNPLRPDGGLAPFTDFTAPTINDVTFWRAGRTLRPGALSGSIDLVVDAFDVAADVAPHPWPVSPAVVRWRLWRGRVVVARWRTAVDSRAAQLPDRDFDAIYAPGTRQNRPKHPGRYCYHLARGWDSADFANGRYRLEVVGADVLGNRTVASLPIRISN
jgi:murein DD-endopeptidase MepM/ murein hydrolase activator NlpD